MKLGVPGQRGDLDRAVADRDAGMRAGQQLAAREHGGNEQRNSRGQDLETQHDTHSLSRQARIRGAYGWRSVNKTRYRRVDGDRAFSCPTQQPSSSANAGDPVRRGITLLIIWRLWKYWRRSGHVAGNRHVEFDAMRSNAILAARYARGLLDFPPHEKEGAGKAGRRLHPRSRARSARVDHRSTGSPGFPCANGLRLIVLSPVSRAFLPPSPCGLRYMQPGWAGCISTRLDASMGASGPHDFAVRARLAKALAGARTSPTSSVEAVLSAVRPRAGDRSRSSIRPAIPCAPDASRPSHPTRVRDVRNAPCRAGRPN